MVPRRWVIGEGHAAKSGPGVVLQDKGGLWIPLTLPWAKTVKGRDRPKVRMILEEVVEK